MKLPFLSQSKSLDSKKLNSSTTYASSPQQWPFPTCGNINTLSFRAKDDAFRTFNSAYLDTDMTASTESFFTVSSSSRSFSTMSDDFGDPIESVIRGLRSDRLFFQPERSCSLVVSEHEDEAEAEAEDDRQEEEEEEESSSSVRDMEVESSDEKTTMVYKESELLSMDSSNPYEDFRRSMEEMVEAHGLKDWRGLEELLGCYLKINGENTHAYIMGAFIDLLLTLSFTNTSSSTPTNSSSSTSTSTSSTSSSLLSTNMNCSSSSPSSPLSLPSSSLTTPCLSSLLDHDDDDHDHDDDNHDDDDGMMDEDH